MIDQRQYHQHLLKDLEKTLSQQKGDARKIRIKKKTISNVFRYNGRKATATRVIDLSKFNKPLFVDTGDLTLDVQGLTTYETIVDYLLPAGLLPTITPELKNITIGGAIVGIGLETNSYRYGFVHDGLLEAEVLLPDGKVVVCTPNNQHADLFHGLANSYGTLGYILRAKIRLRKITPYVELHTRQFDSPQALLAAMQKAAQDKTIDYVEGLGYSKSELYLTTAKHAKAAKNVKSIYGETIFYKEISRPNDLTLTIKDFVFRYDPEWYWAIPDSGFYKAFRKIAPRRLRTSGFYSRYYDWNQRLAKGIGPNADENIRFEKLFQDWEVPWQHAEALLTFALENVDLMGKPWMIGAIKGTAQASCYPMHKDAPYLNLGSYNFAKIQTGKPVYHNTRIMDEFCFSHDGIKMLYSTTFIDEKEFNKLYNGAAYAKLKAKYDPHKLLPTLFEKAVKAH